MLRSCGTTSRSGSAWHVVLEVVARRDAPVVAGARGPLVTSWLQCASGAATTASRGATVVVSPRSCGRPTPRRAERSLTCTAEAGSDLWSDSALRVLLDLVERHLAKRRAPVGRGLDLVPGAWGGDVGMLPAPHRIGTDRRLGGTVLRPVEEDLAGSLRLGHLPEHEVGVLLGQLLRQGLGDRADLVGGSVAVQLGIQLHPLAATGDRLAVQSHVRQPLAHQKRHPRALGQTGA